MSKSLVQKLGLGTVQFGMEYGISNRQGQTPQNEVSTIIHEFRQSGGKFIDTASAYGIAEKVLGKNNLDGFLIISKFMPPSLDLTVQNQFDQTLSDLGVQKLYAYLAHRPKHLIEHPETWKTLLNLKSKGLIKKAGVSLSDPGELNSLIDMGISPELIQVPFNYFDRRFVESMKRMHETGCEVHVRSVFLQGLFFTEIESLPDFFDEIKETIGDLQNSFKDLSGELLRFAIHQPYIDVVIVGVENVSQLKKNICSLHGSSNLPILKDNPSDHILNPSNWQN